MVVNNTLVVREQRLVLIDENHAVDAVKVSAVLKRGGSTYVVLDNQPEPIMVGNMSVAEVLASLCPDGLSEMEMD